MPKLGGCLNQMINPLIGLVAVIGLFKFTRRNRGW